MKTLFTLVILVSPFFAMGQKTVKGTIKSNTKEALIGATIQVAGQSNGAVTDTNGVFQLENVAANELLIVSYLGYKTDTISPVFDSEMEIILFESDEAMKEVLIRGRSESVVDEAPFLSILITESELQKAACCNLSESFETNASVDVSYADAVTGTKCSK